MVPVYTRFASLVIALVWANAALAQDERPPPSPSDWQFEVTGYLFASAMEGDTGIRNIDAEVDVDFSDLVDKIELGAMAFLAGKNDTWSFLVDGAYVSIVDDSSNAHAVGNTALTTNLEVELKQAWVEGFVGRRIFANPDAKRPYRVDAIAGFRYMNIQGEISAQAALLGATLAAQREREVDWIDPLIGIRAEWQVADRFRLLGWADYGGFGVGSDSTWQIVVGGNYAVTERVSIYGLYRALAFDFEEGSGADRIKLDLTLSGPMAGVGYRF